jgi:hypothetical protein
LILDLREHDQTWVRNRFGDRHLGFSSTELDSMLRAAGLTDVRVHVGASKAGDPFAVLIASGVKLPSSGKPKSQVPSLDTLGMPRVYRGAHPKSKRYA